MRRTLALSALLLVFCLPAGASFVLRYELRLGPTERYTALVILADHFGRNFGHHDDLSRLLATGYHFPGTAFLARYLPIPYEWYIAQIEDHPEIYGADRDAIVAELRRHHGIDENVSAVVITEHDRIHKPLALLRIGTADDRGLTASMRMFLDRGFEADRVEAVVPRVLTRDVPEFLAVPGLPRFFDVTRPTRVIPHRWAEGERIEVKNFAMDRATKGKFLRYLYHIAWAHKMFLWGSRTYPEELLTLPDGSRLPRGERLRTGRRVSDIWVANYGSRLRGLYESFGYTWWGMIPRERLGWQQDSHFLRATPDELHARMARVAEATLRGLRGQRMWLVHDPIPVCVDDVGGN